MSGSRIGGHWGAGGAAAQGRKGAWARALRGEPRRDRTRRGGSGSPGRAGASLGGVSPLPSTHPPALRAPCRGRTGPLQRLHPQAHSRPPERAPRGAPVGAGPWRDQEGPKGHSAPPPHPSSQADANSQGNLAGEGEPSRTPGAAANRRPLPPAPVIPGLPSAPHRSPRAISLRPSWASGWGGLSPLLSIRHGACHPFAADTLDGQSGLAPLLASLVHPGNLQRWSGGRETPTHPSYNAPAWRPEARGNSTPELPRTLLV